MKDKVYWRGIGKLIEECGEVLQIAGKALVFPTGKHPDGKGTVRSRLNEEIPDLYAALDYFCEVNKISIKRVTIRRMRKLMLFRKWGLSGVIQEEVKK